MTKRSFTALSYAENGCDEGLLRQKLGSRLLALEYDAGQPVLRVTRESLLDVIRTLKEDPALAFDYFTDLTAADLSRRTDFEPERRFQVVIVLYSLSHKRRIRVKVSVPEADPRCPSIYGYFKGASFTEREAYEMFGIKFEGHPNLIRLLTPEYMKSFPLRKEYPMTGKGERDNFPRYEEIQ